MSIHLILKHIALKGREKPVWLALLASVASGLLLFPSGDAGYAIVDIDGYRGLYNSAWIGESFALVYSMLVSLFGFYAVTGGITRDHQHKRLPLLLANQTQARGYLVRHFIANLCWLFVISLCGLLSSMLAEWALSDTNTFELGAYLLPFLSLILPALLITGVCSVLFEICPGIGRQRARVGYFVFWCIYSSASAFGLTAHQSVSQQMAQGVYPGVEGIMVNIGLIASETAQRTFEWSGADYNMSVLMPMIWQVLIAVLLFVLLLWLGNKSTLLNMSELASTQNSGKAKRITAVIRRLSIPFLPALITAEIKVQLQYLGAKQFGVWTIIALIALLIPVSGHWQVILLVTSVLPLFSLSRMSTRDRENHTQSLLSACPTPALNITLSRLAASGVLLLLLHVLLMVKLSISGQYYAVLHIVGFCMLMPASALLLGKLTGSNKLFEVLYCIAWIAGPLNKTAALDFIGTTQSHQAAVGTAVLAGLMALSIALLNWDESQ